MKKILINADIGERGPSNSIDLQLMHYLDIANIACGGHAGDADSVRAFRSLAEKRKVLVTAHLSYPDKKNFGRSTINMPFDKLKESLFSQLQMLPGVFAVKLHGALYNDSCNNARLAEFLCNWLLQAEIKAVITIKNAELDIHCQKVGISVISEAFADRRYSFSEGTGRLNLVNRKNSDACITDLPEAMENVRNIMHLGKVFAKTEDPTSGPRGALYQLAVDSICIHSDSPIALDIAKGAASQIHDHPAKKKV